MIGYTSESVPTNIRPQFLGICVIFGRLAVVLIPFYLHIHEQVDYLDIELYYAAATGLAVFLIKYYFIKEIYQKHRLLG
jgi:hypothetical protein